MNHVAITKAVLEAINRFDFETIERHIHDDIVLEIPFPSDNVPAMLRGKQIFMMGMRALGQILKEFTLTATEIYDCPATEAVVFEMTSRGILVNGIPYLNEYFMTFIFRDAKIWLWREGYNPQLRRVDMASMYRRK